MAELSNIIEFLSNHLDVETFKDPSRNGLQVQGGQNVQKIALGVSSSLELFQRSSEIEAQAILVHHGLIWDKVQRITGLFAERIGFLLERKISLLAYHLPLDAHVEDGNNAQIAHKIGLDQFESWGDYRGSSIGALGSLGEPQSALKVAEKITELCGSSPHILGDRDKAVKKIAICSGGGGSLVEQAIDDGADLFITGEPGEPTQAIARESGIVVLGGGHYNTETFGVRALGKRLEAEFGLKTEFIDVPNPI